MAAGKKKESEIPTHDCSFCGKNQNDVKTLILGPKVSICDECVYVCVELILVGSQKPETDEHKSKSRLVQEFWNFFIDANPANAREVSSGIKKAPH